jgi:hypothetical protein
MQERQQAQKQAGARQVWEWCSGAEMMLTLPLPNPQVPQPQPVMRTKVIRAGERQARQMPHVAC